MSKVDPKLVVLQFNECINNRDIKGQSKLMIKDHVFIYSSDDIHRGDECFSEQMDLEVSPVVRVPLHKFHTSAYL